MLNDVLYITGVSKLCLVFNIRMVTQWCPVLQRSDETEEEAAEKKELDEEEKPDPIKQLITCLSRAATKEQQSSMPEDSIYISFAMIMSQV